MSTTLASELFAFAHEMPVEGDQECHWCGARCGRKWPHGMPPRTYFVPVNKSARRPSSPYLCAGCWLYAMPRVTVRWLGGGLRDSQCWADHSWLLTEKGVWGIRGREDGSRLLEVRRGLEGPCGLALRSEGSRRGPLLQHAVINKGEDVLRFTLDDVPHEFTKYDLGEAVKTGELSGKMPGTRALAAFVGGIPKPPPVIEPKRPRGRPPYAERDAESVTQAG